MRIDAARMIELRAMAVQLGPVVDRIYVLHMDLAYHLYKRHNPDEVRIVRAALNGAELSPTEREIYRSCPPPSPTWEAEWAATMAEFRSLPRPDNAREWEIAKEAYPPSDVCERWASANPGAADVDPSGWPY